MSARKPESFVLPLCEADRCWQCPGINADYDRCSCRCHDSAELSDDEIEDMRKTMEKRDDARAS